MKEKHSIKGRCIYTLLKDMQNNRITFYLSDRIYNGSLHYTLFSNNISQYFLMTDDG
jgi:hypothetical protein